MSERVSGATVTTIEETIAFPVNVSVAALQEALRDLQDIQERVPARDPKLSRWEERSGQLVLYFLVSTAWQAKSDETQSLCRRNTHEKEPIDGLS